MKDGSSAVPLCKPEELCMLVALAVPIRGWRGARVDINGGE